MKIILSTKDIWSAQELRDQIIKSLKGEIEDVDIKTWSYKQSKEGYDILYHDVEQYSQDEGKNVIFKMEIDDSEVTFTTGWWKNHPEPSEEMFCEHTGRLTEMLLRYFRNMFIKLRIV